MLRTKVKALLSLAAIMLLIAALSGAGAAATDITIIINGEQVTADEPPRIVNDRTLVPIRVISEYLGAGVEWVEETQQVHITWGDRGIVLTIGEQQAWVDGKPFDLDVAPQIMATATVGRTMVPLRFAGEALGAQVGWDEATRTVTVARGASTLLAVEYREAAGGGIPLIRVQGPVQPKAFVLPDPDRLVVDFPHTRLAAGEPFVLPVDDGPVHQIRAAQFEAGTARVVVDLKQPVDYRLHQAGDVWQVLLGSAAPLPGLNQGSGDGRDGLVLKEIRWDDEEGSPRLHLTEARPEALAVQQQGRELIIELPGTRLGMEPGLQEVGFGPIRAITIDGDPHGPSAQLIVHLAEPRPHQVLSYGEGNQVTIAFADDGDKPGAGPEEGDHPLRGLLVVVDPGHGGRDPGSTSGRVFEKHLTLTTARELADMLRAVGARVVLTRTADVEVDKYDRAYMANDLGADVFVSIHFNAFTRPDMAGTETYHHETDPAGARLARLVHEAVRRELGRPDRGVRTADFVVLRETTMPAVLVEALYLTNPQEEAMAVDPAVQRRIAQAIMDGLARFFR
ncbi:MAG TPA: N-acetylmuramoyl-L-alanine amidase family protein [Sphingobacteriaceae bacterium]|nr:N-acetylmuramoyl-L-alanine amidase family protein [Sphingobacteriaceae bacterium]